MAALNLAKLQGYNIDVSNLLFVRSDGKRFLMCNGTGTTGSTNMENITISNGWATDPRTVINTTTTTTIQYTTNMFDAWLIAGMNGLDATQGSVAPTMFDVYEVEAVTGDNTHGHIVIDREVSNVAIDGLVAVTDTTPVSAGKFKATADNGETVIELMLSDLPVGAKTGVSYTVTDANGWTIEWDQSIKTVSGKLYRLTPLYGEDDQNAGIAAYVCEEYGRVKVTQLPNLDNSYKAESQQTIEFTTLAAKGSNAAPRKMYIIDATAGQE